MDTMAETAEGNEDGVTGRGAPSTGRRRNPELLNMLGVSEEELNDPGTALLSAGVQKMWAVLEAMKLPLEEVGDAGNPTPGPSPFHREGRTATAAPPIWQSISGLFSDAAHSPEGRERRLRTLMDVVLKLLRHEMEAERGAPNVYHTVYWDPLLKICVQLGISRSHLSRLAKEATGLAAHELLDGIRVEKVKEAMKASIRRFVGALKKEKLKRKKDGVLDGGTDGLGLHGNSSLGKQEEELEISAAEIWVALKEARRGPHFHRGAWALSYGFSNYQRFYRACLFYHKLAPSQVEFAAIEEVLEEIQEGAGEGEASARQTGMSAPPDEFAAQVKNLDEVMAGMKERQVQFFTELSAHVWRDALAAARGRNVAAAG